MSLLTLFQFCNKCQLPTPSITKLVFGTFIRIKQWCDNCEAERIRDSQPNIPTGNLLFSAILLTGSLPEQSLRVLRKVGCASITSRNYFIHQRWFLFTAISKTWNMYHEALVAMLQSDHSTLVLGGDGRADSPGHSAKYGTYTLMELSHNIILDIQLVQVIITLHNFNLFLFIQSNKVGGSYHMELEGLKRGIMELEQ